MGKKQIFAFSNHSLGRGVAAYTYLARGFDEKYIGPYLVIDICESNCEIESLENKKRKATFKQSEAIHNGQ